MENPTLHLVTQIIMAIGAIGTGAVAILAVWGEKMRNMVAGPRLEFELYNARGDLNTRQGGGSTIYYHVKIKNRRTWAPAKRVRILCTAIQKKAPDGSFEQKPLIIPVQLTWPFPTFHELLPNVANEKICDLGFLDEGSKKFSLPLYVTPNNFQGFISANEAMRVGLIASADNFTSKSPYVIEISWDGKWSTNLNEMQKHLIIKEVKNS